MTLEEFKIKHSNLINIGVITFNQTHDAHYINIDRFDGGGEFLCEANELNPSRNDAKKMGYTLTGFVGCYKKEIQIDYINAKDALLHLVVGGKTLNFPYNISHEIDKIKKPLIYNGVRLDMYFIWKNYIFCQMAGFYQYIGVMEE